MSKSFTVLTILRDINNELQKARETFPPFNSAHEGHAIIAEELDELWREVQANKAGTGGIDNPKEMRKEAIQVAAMTVRFVYDLIDLDHD